MRDSREARTARHYKYAFDPDFNENGKNGDHYVGGLSERQKSWFRMVYLIIRGGIHCIFPVWRDDKMEYCGNPEVQLHHITPQGEARHFLNENPNRPDNIVPLCKEHHVKGQRGKELTREEQDVVHLDQAYALRHYGEDPKIHEKIRENAHRLVEEGKEYHVPFWDSWFRKDNQEVMGEYFSREDAQPFPEKKKRGVKIVRNEWDEQSQSWIKIEE